VSKGGGGKWVDVEMDYGIKDGEEAEELAKGKLRERSLEYMKAEGSGEGNAKLFAGMGVEIKNVGMAYIGEYIAENVVYRHERVLFKAEHGRGRERSGRDGGIWEWRARRFRPGGEVRQRRGPGRAH
jgi:hypothetical protein